jgi:site-specific DNA-methyltransferase (adenine-specific)
MIEIHDYPETDICFPNLNIRGGVCFFLWASSHKGDVKVVNYSKANEANISIRPLLENGLDTFIRYNKAISIIQKVKILQEETFGNVVFSRNVFGIPSNFENFSKSKTKNTPILLYRSRRGQSSDKVVYVSKSKVLKNDYLIDEIKVLVSKVSPGGDEYPHAILTKPIIALSNSVCTETYLLLSTFKTITLAENFVTYISTRFCRFLVSLIKNTQNISKSCFDFVPIQDFSEPWTDEKLYKKYGLTIDEISFIESMIRPMDLNTNDDEDE